MTSEFDTVTILKIIALSVAEIISLMMVIRLWAREHKKSILGLLGWSIVLLIPVFGPAFYLFVTVSPDAHGERLPEYPPD